MKLPNFFRKKAANTHDKILGKSIEILEAKLSQSGNRPEDAQILEDKLRKLPSITEREIYWGHDSVSGLWWCTFQIDISHPDAFRTVHYIGHDLNHPSGMGFQGVFYPTAPTYFGNPETNQFLEWMIDSWDGETTPVQVSEMIELAVYELGEEE